MEQELETKERNKRVVELLTRKDEIGDDIAKLGEQMNALGSERANIEEELAELLGIQRTNGAVAEKQRHCSRCGQVGHSVRTCPQPTLEV